MIRNILSVLLVSVFALPTLAQQPLLIQDDQVRSCPEQSIEILGANQGIVGRTSRYGLRTSLTSDQVVSVSHEIWRGDEFLMSYPTSLFDLQIDDAGQYRIKSLITTNTGCVYVSQSLVSIYERLIVLVGETLDEVTLLSETVDPLTTEITQLASDTLGSSTSQETIATATTLIIQADALPEYLQRIGDMAQVERLYVISDFDRATYRKLLATYSSLTSFNELVVIERDAVGSFFTNLILRPEEETLITQRQVFEPGQDEEVSRSPLGSIIESAIGGGVSLQIIRFFLLIPLLALVMTILRQVVGLTTYSIWYPLIIAWTGIMIGWYEVALLIIAGALSVLLVAGLTKKIYMLSGAKTALIGAVYALFCVIGFWVMQQYEWIELDIIQQSMALYTIMILYVCMSIFRSPSSMTKFKRWKGLIQFVIVTWVVVYLLGSEFIFDQLLATPDILWAVVVLIVVVGRFTGLQLTEYARFMPLIGHLLSEEEEE